MGHLQSTVMIGSKGNSFSSAASIMAARQLTHALTADGALDANAAR